MATIINVDGTEKTVEPKNGKMFSLEELQKYVNGYIEIVAINSGEYENMLMIVDEEGLLKSNEINEAASMIAGQRIVGTVLVIDKDQID